MAWSNKQRHNAPHDEPALCQAGGINKAGEGDVSDIADEGRPLLKTRSR